MGYIFSISPNLLAILSRHIIKSDCLFSVNAINDPDPLEIYTTADGEVIFKKYSPIGELSDFAANYAETLAKTSGHGACITDRDNIIAVSGMPKKGIIEKPVSSELENVMNEKLVFNIRTDDKKISLVEGIDNYSAGVIVPIVSEGDTIGSVVFVMKDGEKPGEVESKLAESAAGFLGRHMEN